MTHDEGDAQVVHAFVKGMMPQGVVTPAVGMALQFCIFSPGLWLHARGVDLHGGWCNMCREVVMVWSDRALLWVPPAGLTLHRLCRCIDHVCCQWSLWVDEHYRNGIHTGQQYHALYPALCSFGLTSRRCTGEKMHQAGLAVPLYQKHESAAAASFKSNSNRWLSRKIVDSKTGSSSKTSSSDQGCIHGSSSLSAGIGTSSRSHKHNMGKKEAASRSSKRKSDQKAAEPELHERKKAKKETAEAAQQPKAKQKKDQKPAKKKAVLKPDDEPKPKAKSEAKSRTSRAKKQQEQEQQQEEEEQVEQEEPEVSVHDTFMEEVHAKEAELQKHCLIMEQVGMLIRAEP